VQTVGAAIAYLGFAALGASAVWTVAPLTPHGLFERHMVAFAGLVLVAAGALGRGRLAASLTGKLLCALGAGLCLRLAVDPTFESLPSVGSALPMWAMNAYPGLPTVGWIVAALGTALWALGGGQGGELSPYRGAAVVVVLLLALVTVAVRLALAAAGYEVPGYENGLLIWRLVEAGLTMLMALTASGGRCFGPGPLTLLGLALIGHAAHAFLAPGDA
jgi:hypothetical protein